MADAKEDKPDTAKVQFHYIKGQTYREAACHGAIGGETTQGKIWMALYTERHPIPRTVEYEVAGKPGDTVEFNEQATKPSNIESRHGIIRHIETTVYMDLEVAKRVHAWLGRHIEKLEKGQENK